ncbi:hypothetical protein [Enterobacter mori]|uniref:hypothetical protein n=1 Tax=Enterobacter mori TaxID=539813 RepID=UPI001B8D22EE|nr:hypothetical protein [Enterobacter mori]MBS3049211.1 hypothetical protein [Enterobacter mori]
MWDPSTDKDVDCVVLEIESLNELLSLMNTSANKMNKAQTESLLGLALNLSSNVYIWLKEEERRRDAQSTTE